MAYQALYRVWRPGKFGELVGQEHVARTLQNACRHDRIAHAYLFCGPRGTGKTSTARLMAKAVNCLDAAGGEPCNQCPNCLAVNNGSSVDVIEIDAASNRGIEEIKSLRERVKFSPSGSRYRVYIIDEVHMLSHDAFNAFLKTLEEPPAHVIFILATTEAHKVPLTILSRCQRFDFRRIGEGEISGRLAEIAAAAGLHVEKEAYDIIARSAEGGLRDAISILDQAAATGESTVTAEGIHNLLGTVTAEAIETAADHLVNSRTPPLLELVADLEKWGKDPKLFLRDLAGHLRRRLLADLGRGGEASRLWYVLHVLTDAEQALARAGQPGLVLELALIRASHPEWGFLPEEMSRRLEQVEQRLVTRGGIEVVAPAPVRVAPPAGAAAPKEAEKRAAGPAGQTLIRASHPEEEFLPEETHQRQVAPPAGTKEKKDGPRVDQKEKEEQATRGYPPWVEQAAAADQPPVGKKPDEGAPCAQGPAPVEPGPADGDALTRIKQVWPAVLEKVKAENPHLFNFVRKATPVQVEGDRLILGFAGGDEFFREYFERGDFGASLAGLLSGVCPGKWRIGSVLAGQTGAGPAKRKAPAAGAVEETGFYLEKLFDARPVKDSGPRGGGGKGG